MEGVGGRDRGVGGRDGRVGAGLGCLYLAHVASSGKIRGG